MFVITTKLRHDILKIVRRYLVKLTMKNLKGDIKMRVLWFSRHTMTEEQSRIFKGMEIVQIDRTINSAYELQEEIEMCDIIAIVAPINLQQQFLKIAGNKPVIIAESERMIERGEDGEESKVVFKFKCWKRLKKIEVVMEDFIL